MQLQDFVIKQTQPVRVALATAPGLSHADIGVSFGRLLPQVISYLEASGAKPGISVGACEDEGGTVPEGEIVLHARSSPTARSIWARRNRDMSRSWSKTGDPWVACAGAADARVSALITASAAAAAPVSRSSRGLVAPPVGQLRAPPCLPSRHPLVAFLPQTIDLVRPARFQRRGNAACPI